MKKETEETEETALVVLPEIKYLVTVDEIKAFVAENKELEDLDPAIGIKDETYLDYRKKHLKSVGFRTGIEKKRKEIVSPAWTFMKEANGIAEEYTALLADTEARLFTQRHKVEQYEKVQEQKRIDDEQERLRIIDNEISKLRMLPSNFIGESSEKLTTLYGSITIPDDLVFKERLTEAIEVYKDTMSKLESMIATAKQAEEVEVIRAEAEAKHQAEKKIADDKARVERESLEKERAEFEEEKRAMQAEKDAKAEEDRKKEIEAKADLDAKQREADALEAEKKVSEEYEKSYAESEKQAALNYRETLVLMLGIAEKGGIEGILKAIINNEIKSLSYGR